MARHGVEKLAPEIEAPHLGDVRLGGVAGVGVTGGAEVEGDVELDAAAGDVGWVAGVADFVAEAEGLGEVEAAVHRAGGVGGEDRGGLATAADAVRLRGAGAPREAEFRGGAAGGFAGGQDDTGASAGFAQSGEIALDGGGRGETNLRGGEAGLGGRSEERRVGKECRSRWS